MTPALNEHVTQPVKPARQAGSGEMRSLLVVCTAGVGSGNSRLWMWGSSGQRGHGAVSLLCGSCF